MNASALAPTPVPLLGFGQVRHKRLRPVVNAFAYPTYLLMLPLRSLHKSRPARGWQINTSGPLSFFEMDHGDGRAPEQGGALAWLDELLHQHGIFDATGEAWLQCYPRVLGFTFKPVSFWYCHRAPHDQSGALRAIVVEVNNTFGERHCYLLDAPRLGLEMQATKVFHVSPFCPVQGHYRFRFMRTQAAHAGRDRLVARIDYYDDTVGSTNPLPILQTSVSASLEPLTPQAIRRALWRYPAMTLGVVMHIHTQALRLWLSKVPFFSKPAPPKAFVTRA
jgi:DUF1365 family protein